MKELLVIAIGVPAVVKLISVACADQADRFMEKHNRIAEFFNYFDGDEEDTKKAPVAATTGTRNFSKTFYEPIVSRKAVK